MRSHAQQASLESGERSDGEANGSQMSEELWALAVELAVEHGVARTSTALSLSYYALKDKLEERQASETKLARASSAFVEVPIPTAPESVACTIELKDAAGTQLTLRFENANAVDVAALGRSLWGER